MKKEYEATNYESDLTDKQWEAIKEFFPSGNKSKYHKRSLVEAVLYIVKTGCQWRILPHDYPPHDTVWSFYRRARENGVWDKMMKHLVKITRKQEGNLIRNIPDFLIDLFAEGIRQSIRCKLK